jgi:hypothetical protein
MILAHENHAPVMVKLAGGGLGISAFRITINIELVLTEEVNEAEYEEDDEKYTEHRYLTKENEYPECVTFFAGRLVFADTKNNRQRIFASPANGLVPPARTRPTCRLS